MPINEPNNTISEALPITFPPNGVFTDTGAIDTNNDVDFISLVFSAGDRITIDIDTNPPTSSLDSVLRLFDSNGNQLAFSDDTNAPSEAASRDSYIDFTAINAGTYYIGISSFANFNYDPNTANSGSGGSTTGAYTIEITSESSNDLFEPNETSAAATILVQDPVDPFGELLIEGQALQPISGFGFRDNLIITQGESDWFQFQIDSPGGLEDKIAINFLHSLGDLDLELYDPNTSLTVPIRSSTSVNDFESISLEGLTAGTYYARVYGYQGVANPDYSLNIFAPVTAGGSSADRFEPNNSSAEATPLVPDQFGEIFESLLNIDDQDNAAGPNGGDWFQFDIGNPGGEFGDEVKIEFLHSAGDLDLELYQVDPTTNTNIFIDSSTSVDNFESISLAGLAAGTYQARVYGFAGATNNYDLTINVPSGQGIVGDRYEPNNDPTTAAPIVSGIYDGLSIDTAIDTDWYSFELSEAGRFNNEVRIVFDGFSADLDLELYQLDSTGAPNFIDYSYFGSNSETISLNGLAAGNYLALVSGYLGDTGNYSLTLNAPGGTGGVLPDDRYEQGADPNNPTANNNTRELAYNLGTVQGQWIPPYSDFVLLNDDWHQFNLADIGQLGNEIRIDFDHSQGDIDLQLYQLDPTTNTETLIDISESVSNFESISLTGLTAGTYYARVYGYPPQNAPTDPYSTNPQYSLSLNAPFSITAPTLTPDIYEPNNNSDLATQIRESEPIKNLSIHAPNDDDWYAFSLAFDGQFGESVEIDFDHALGDLDIELYEALAPTIPIRISQGIENSEVISLEGLRQGDYLLRVYGFSGATNPNYNLNVNAFLSPTAPGEAILVDQFEANDSPEQASPLEIIQGSNTYQNLTIHAENNRDWYQFTTAAAGPIEVKVDNFDHQNGDIDLQVYSVGANNQPVPLADPGGGLSNSITNSETVSFISAPGGSYFVEVFGYNGATNPNYTLTIDTPLGDQIRLDEYEVNDNRDQATQIRDFNVPLTNLNIHNATDQDWFSFTTGAQGTFDDLVWIEFDVNQGDLDLALLDAQGNPVPRAPELQITSPDEFPGIEAISLQGLAPGQYFAQVQGNTGATNPNYSLSVSATPETQPGISPAADEWTILVYVAADNDLEAFGIDDINEMESVLLPDNVNVVVQVDRTPGFDTSNGDWRETRRGLIQYDPNSDTNNRAIVSNLQAHPNTEQNMGDSATLQDFITWGTENYQAEKYALVVWDHGAGLSGTSWDDTSNDNLSIPEMTRAVEAAINANTTLNKIDLIGFDACLQGLIEQGYDLNGLTDVVVASQDLEPGNGWDYEGLLQSLEANPNLSAEDLGAAIVSSYDSFYRGTQTLSATRTSAYTALTQAIDNFVGAVDNATEAQWNGIIEARYAAPYFYEPTYVDLGGFMTLIADRVTGPIAQAATAVANALNDNNPTTTTDAVISQVGVQGATGLSVYVPPASGSPLRDYNQDNFRYLRDTRWDDFIQGFSSRQGTNRIQEDYLEIGTATRGVSLQADNNIKGRGTDLGKLSGAGNTFSDLNIGKPGDIDWYRFKIADPGAAGNNVQITFNHDLGDLTLQLWDATGTNQILQSATSNSQNNLEEVSLEGQAAGEYYIRVVGADPTVVNPKYNLVVNAPSGAGGAVIGDWAEGTGKQRNDFVNKATDLGSIAFGQESTFKGLTIDAIDSTGTGSTDPTTTTPIGGDWYLYNPTRGTQLNTNQVYISFDNARGNIDMYLYEYDLTSQELGKFIGSSTTQRDIESVSFAETNTAIAIQVVAAAPDVTNSYELDLVRRLLDIDGNGDASVADLQIALVYEQFSSPGAVDPITDLNTAGVDALDSLVPATGLGLVQPGADKSFGSELANYLKTSNEMVDVDGDGNASVADLQIALIYEQFSSPGAVDPTTGLNTAGVEALDSLVPSTGLGLVQPGAIRRTGEELAQFLEIYTPEDSSALI
ncbi:MAG: DVUA0089 family protein [Prochloraceae cyanobacterium]|nr:DVUA0089 family protein [Prochloraceae cyanobacterium]